MLLEVVKMKISNVWSDSSTIDVVLGCQLSAELKNANYPRNKELDMSCAYGLSKGKYSPMCNLENVVVTYNMTDTNSITQINTDVIYTSNSTPYNYLILSNCGDTASAADSHDGEKYNYNWGYDVEITEDWDRYYNVGEYVAQFITGFTYNNTCLYVDSVRCCNKNFDKFATYESLNDYLEVCAEYPYIITIRYAIVTGIEGSQRQAFYRSQISSKYEHEYNKYTITAGILEKIEKYGPSIDYITTNNCVALGCAFTYSGVYSIPFTTDIARTESASVVVNPQFLETTILNNTAGDLGAGLNPRIYKYYDFEKNGIEPINKIMSTLGLVWCYDEDVALNGDMFTDDDRFYYPILTNGFYQGDYVKGETAKEIPQANWGSDFDEWYDENGVVPEPDTNDYVDKIDLNNPTLNTLNTFNRTFCLSKHAVNDLSAYLWNSDGGVFENIVEGLKLMGQNPINGIIDLRLYPFDVSALTTSNNSTTITIGRCDTGVSGIMLNGASNCVIDMGSVKFQGYHKSFLDFEPYTQALLYVPYIGTISLDIANFINKVLSVKLIIDFTTGFGTAVVYSDDIPYIYENANIGVNVAVSGDNASQYAQGVLSAGFSAVQGVAQLGVGGVSGNVSMLGGGAVSAVVNGYNAFAQPVQIQQSGRNTPNCSNWCPQHCYLIISSPIVNKPNNYGHNIGYACEVGVKIGDVQGFSVFSNIDGTGLLCSDIERTEIINLLNNGVYL